MADVIKSQVLLVDDHPVFRAGLSAYLDREPDLQVVGEASSAAQGFELARERAADIAVIDVLMPGGSGLALAAQLRDLRPSFKVLALSVLDEPVMIATMLQAGACGYALKLQPAPEITEAIRTVLTGTCYLPPTVPSSAVLSLLRDKTDQPLERLTRRERDILELLIRGNSNDEIATTLFIARRTVETHRQRIMKKLATHSILELIRVAARYGALVD